METTDRTIKDEITLWDLIMIVWRGRYSIIITMVVCTAAAIGYALLQQSIYSSHSKLITKTTSNQSGSLSNLAALAGISIGNNQTADPSVYLDEVVEDEPFIRKILDMRWYCNGDSLSFDSLFNLNPDTTQPHWEYVFYKTKLDFFRKAGFVSLSRDKQSGIINLSTKFKDPQIAYDMNRRVIGLLDDYILNTLKSQAKEKRLFIEERLDEVKEDLRRSENTLAAFRERNISTATPKLMLQEMRLTRKVTLNQEIYLQLQKQYELSRIEEKNNHPLIEIIKNPEIPISRSAPNRKMLAILGMFGGLFLGFFLVFVRQWYKVNARLYHRTFPKKKKAPPRHHPITTTEKSNV